MHRIICIVAILFFILLGDVVITKADLTDTENAAITITEDDEGTNQINEGQGLGNIEDYINALSISNEAKEELKTKIAHNPELKITGNEDLSEIEDILTSLDKDLSNKNQDSPLDAPEESSDTSGSNNDNENVTPAQNNGNGNNGNGNGNGKGNNGNGKGNNGNGNG